MNTANNACKGRSVQGDVGVLDCPAASDHLRPCLTPTNHQGTGWTLTNYTAAVVTTRGQKCWTELWQKRQAAHFSLDVEKNEVSSWFSCVSGQEMLSQPKVLSSILPQVHIKRFVFINFIFKILLFLFVLFYYIYLYDYITQPITYLNDEEREGERHKLHRKKGMTTLKWPIK